MNTLPPIVIDPKKFLRNHCTLPMLPTVINRVQNEMAQVNVDVNRVIHLISGDPSLAAQILKVVNSGYYGLPREVSRLRFAITFLGLNEVYRMLLSLSVIKTLDINDEKELKSFWFHSAYTALCAKHLAKRYAHQLNFEDLWSAAILHDIGKLVYLKFFPDHYRAMRQYCRKQECLFTEAERHFGFPSSAYVGTLLCDHWRLPDLVRQACEAHSLDDLGRLPPDNSTDAFQRMICLGNLAATLSAEELNEDTRRNIAGAIAETLHCTEEQFLGLMGEIYELRIEVDRFMDSL